MIDFTTSTSNNSNMMTMTMNDPRHLMSAREKYDAIEEFNTDSYFNQPAPDPWVSFVIGGIFLLYSFLLWVRRIAKIKKDFETDGIAFEGGHMVAAIISALIDADDIHYVVCSYSTISFFLLGGLQIDYEKAPLFMFIFYFLASTAEAYRILLTIHVTDSLKDLKAYTPMLKEEFADMKENELKPSSTYEDIGRGMMTAFMTFALQCFLIAFTAVDVYQTPTVSCLDGTSNCPVVGTMGSWLFFILGIFMALVFLLGPSTNFGASEQHPAFWIQLLILAQKSPKITWNDRRKDNPQQESRLSLTDVTIWVRFVMNFLINGVGFHILMHVLPIQVAAQSSFTGVVFKALGMIYLVCLDNTTGLVLTVVEEPASSFRSSSLEKNNIENSDGKTSTASGKLDADLLDFSTEAQRIIDEARAKLEALKNDAMITKV